jgi:hypothetical protein
MGSTGRIEGCRPTVGSSRSPSPVSREPDWNELGPRICLVLLAIELLFMTPGFR